MEAPGSGTSAHPSVNQAAGADGETVMRWQAGW